MNQGNLEHNARSNPWKTQSQGMHMPKGAALGYVIPSFPAFSLILCWTLVAVAS